MNIISWFSFNPMENQGAEPQPKRSLYDSISRFIEQEVPVHTPSHLTEEQKAKLIKTSREEDDQKFIDKKAIASGETEIAKCINKEGVFDELKEYATYNAHHIRNADDKYQAALEVIHCGLAIDELVNHGQDITNHYYRCEGLRHLLYIATKESK